MLDSLEVTAEDWSDPRTSKYGLKATTRFGLGILRSNAVAKMTMIKTTSKIAAKNKDLFPSRGHFQLKKNKLFCCVGEGLFWVAFLQQTLKCLQIASVKVMVRQV